MRLIYYLRLALLAVLIPPRTSARTTFSTNPDDTMVQVIDEHIWTWVQLFDDISHLRLIILDSPSTQHSIKWYFRCLIELKPGNIPIAIELTGDGVSPIVCIPPRLQQSNGSLVPRYFSLKPSAPNTYDDFPSGIVDARAWQHGQTSQF